MFSNQIYQHLFVVILIKLTLSTQVPKQDTALIDKIIYCIGMFYLLLTKYITYNLL